MLYLHPRIQKAAGEVHFFDRDENYLKGLDWYRKKMPHSFRGQITIEKSPSYFVTPEVSSVFLFLLFTRWKRETWMPSQLVIPFIVILGSAIDSVIASAECSPEFVSSAYVIGLVSIAIIILGWKRSLLPLHFMLRHWLNRKPNRITHGCSIKIFSELTVYQSISVRRIVSLLERSGRRKISERI